MLESPPSSSLQRRCSSKSVSSSRPVAASDRQTCPRTPPDLSGTGGRIASARYFRAQIWHPRCSIPRRQIKASRESSTRGRRMKGCRRARVGGNGPRRNSTGHSRRWAFFLAPTLLQPEISPMLHHVIAAETSPGARAKVLVGEGSRSGHGPVAEFLVGVAASSTARIHRVLSSFARSERGRIRGGNSCEHAEASPMRTRVSHARPIRSRCSAPGTFATGARPSRR